MLRLNVYCSLIPSVRQVKLGSNYGSLFIHNNRASRLSQFISIKALKDEMDGETSKSPGRSWNPGLEIEVPFEQRPVCIKVAILPFFVPLEFISRIYWYGVT